MNKPEFFPIGFDYLSEMFKFSVRLGSETFQYSGGFRAFIPDWEKAKEFAKRQLGEHSRAWSMFRQWEQGRLKFSKNASDPDTYKIVSAFQRCVKAPDEKGFFYSVLSDMRAGEMTFHDFCAEFGYNSDSIKDRDTYFACQANANKLRKVLTTAEITKLEEELQDY